MSSQLSKIDLLWRQLAQRRFAAAEATLASVSGDMDASSAARARALLTLHRDGVAAALRLAPLPDDVFLQCFERAADRRDVALTQLRACARACDATLPAASALASYEAALEVVVFHVLLPSGERASALALLHSDRWLSPDKRAVFLRLIDAPPPLALTPAVASHAADTRAIRPRRLSFDEQRLEPPPPPSPVPRVPPQPDRGVPPSVPDRRRWWLLFLLGSTAVIAAYRAWLWWRRPRKLLANE